MSKLMKSIYAAFLLFAIMGKIEASEQGKNLIKNPGFELGVSSWKINKKKGKKISTEIEVVHKGDISLKLESSDAKGCMLYSAPIKINPNKSYKLSLYINCKGLEKNGFNVNVLAYKANQKVIGWHKQGGKNHKMFQTSGSTDAWVKKEIILNGFKKEAAIVRVYLVLKGKGVCYVDDVSFVEVPLSKSK